MGKTWKIHENPVITNGDFNGERIEQKGNCLSNHVWLPENAWNIVEIDP